MTRISDYSYELPAACIAQEPAAERDGSKLMTLDRRSRAAGHARFSELPGLLREGDLLVLNDSRVVPARLLADKPGGGRAEALLLDRLDGGGDDADAQEWTALVRGLPASSRRAGLQFPGGLRIVMLGREPGSEVARISIEAEGPVEPIIRRNGRVPLPPYIRREDDDPRSAIDRERYQTVYAGPPGAVAAPTAGLHFTERLFEGLRGRGVRIASLTLHVGWGTFQPVRFEELEEHRMHAEWISIPEGLLEAVAAARQAGGRIIAVGTTVVRALEDSAGEDGAVLPGGRSCELFIGPGHRFRVVDGLITNFHLPRSTLLVLVCAFAGRERILAAYAEAVSRGYRFYSYGDAMAIL